jgi:hypothetical protein
MWFGGAEGGDTDYETAFHYVGKIKLLLFRSVCRRQPRIVGSFRD